MTRKNIIIFASGSGTNTENIIKFFQSSAIAKVSLVVTNRSSAGVIERSKKLNVDHWVISKSELSNPDFLDRLKNENPSIIVLAGFLLKIPEKFIAECGADIINIHPSLLPKFGGKGMYGHFVHEAVLQKGEKESGISIHFVNEEYDEGKIISQHKCPVLKEDDVESLAMRIHQLEYQYFPLAIKKVLLDE